MKIFSIRKGFHSDHSSTSYEFFAVDKQLSKAERDKVASLSSRARPTQRRVSFSYNGEWSDLPNGWEPLMEKYYDVMYTESYDWWNLAIAFNAEKEAIAKMKQYICEADDSLGLFISVKKGRVIVEISCVMSEDYFYPEEDDFSNYDEDNEYDEDDDADDRQTPNPKNRLLEILTENRKSLMKGNYHLLYGIWKMIMGDDEIEDEMEPDTPPPYDMKKIPKPVDKLLSFINFEI